MSQTVEPKYHLRTLGSLRLTGPEGDLPPTDPLALPLLCRLAAVADPVSEPDLLLCLTPELTQVRGAARLATAIAALEKAAGVSLVDRVGAHYRVDPARLGIDATVAGKGPPLDAADRARFLGVLGTITPEFDEWVSSVRPHLRRSTVGAPRRLGQVTTVLVGLAGALLLMAVYRTRAVLPPDFQAGDQIVLADLDNSTGDTLFDRSLPMAAAIALRQSRQVSFLPPGRVAGALRRMGVANPATMVTAELAREITRRENLRYFVTLKLGLDGDRYRLEGTIRDAVTNQVIAADVAHAETRAGTIDALDRVIQSLRAGFGERRSERQARSIPLPEATTPSLEALQSYAVGSREWAQGHYTIARQLWERSLDLDTGFALPMASLGSFYYYHHDRVRGKQFYDEALRRAARLTEWEQLRIREGYLEYRGDVDSALAISATIAERFPSATSWYNYGTSLMQAGQFGPAIKALDRAVAADSAHVNSYLNQATSALRLGDHQQALQLYQRAGRVDSTALMRAPIGTEYGGLLIRLGRHEEAARHFGRLTAQTALVDRVLGYRGLGMSALWRGRLEEAVRLFRLASESGRQDGSRLTIVRNALLESLALILAADTTAARRALAAVMPLVDSAGLQPEFLVLVGHGLLRLGEVAAAERVLASIVTRGDTTSASERAARAFLAAATATARRDTIAARLWFPAAAGFGQPHLTRAWRAVAEALLGNRRAAERALDSVLAAPSVTGESTFEHFNAWWSKALLAERAGDPVAAREAYRALAKQWEDGDSSGVLLRTARARLGVAPR